MKTIYKYRISNEMPVELPIGAKFLHLGMQNNQIIAWFEIRPQNHSEQRVFKVYGTGHKITSSAPYLGTVFDGPFVWHIYETTKNEERG